MWAGRRGKTNQRSGIMGNSGFPRAEGHYPVASQPTYVPVKVTPEVLRPRIRSGD